MFGKVGVLAHIVIVSEFLLHFTNGSQQSHHLVKGNLSCIHLFNQLFHTYMLLDFLLQPFQVTNELFSHVKSVMNSSAMLILPMR